MKTNSSYLTIFFILFSISGFCQPTTPDPVGFQPNTWVKENNVVPPSPQAASLGSFGNIPVNYYTGSPNINIPLYSIGGQSISSPITLTYDAQSLRVATVPSWVGWGWTLQAGGVISRSVQGYPDLKFNYYDYESEYPEFQGLALNAYQDNIIWNEFFGKIVCGEIEMQPDVYNFNIPGYAGSFIITHDKNIIQKEFAGLTITPTWAGAWSDYGETLMSFTIKDPLGRVYQFNAYEKSTFQDILDESGGHGECNFSPVFEYISSWHLTSVRSPDSAERLSFQYELIPEVSTDPLGVQCYVEPTNIDMDDSRTYKIINTGSPNYCGTSGGYTLSSGLNRVVRIYERKYLSTITFRNGNEDVEKVEFAQVPVPGHNPNDPQSSGIKLFSIQIKRRWQSQNMKPVLAFLFEFDANHSTGRLTLNSVLEEGFEASTNTWITKPPYLFSYKGSITPSPLSNAIDHWGYYNGGFNSTSLIPNVHIGCATFGAGAARNANYKESGIIEKIIYPTGGYTKFVFEGHRIRENDPYNSGNLSMPIGEKAGGFRIKSIEDRDKSGALASRRTFSYLKEDDTSSGELLYPLGYSMVSSMYHWGWEGCWDPNNPECKDYECTSVTVFASSQNEFAPQTGTHAGYSRVVERIENNGGENIGEKAYEFFNDSNTTQLWNQCNGTLTSMKIYDKFETLVRKDTYDYNFQEGGSTCQLDCPVNQRCTNYHPFKVVSKVDQDNLTILCEYDNNGITQTKWLHPLDDQSDCINAEHFVTKFLKSDYHIQQRWKYLMSTTTTEYFPNNEMVTKTTNYAYDDSQVAQPTSTWFNNSDGKEQRTEIEYFHNNSYNIHAIPKKVTKKVNNQVTGGTNQDLDAYGRTLTIYEILKDESELPRAMINGYNTYGRPEDFQYMAFPMEDFTWTGGLLTMREQGAWAWLYDYDERRMFTSFTDLDGQETKYDYDGLLRLKAMTAMDGNVSTEYDYSYAQDASDDNYIQTTDSYADYPDQVTKQTFDGLGRALQNIRIGYGPQGQDIVTEDLKYDQYGRVEKKVYLQDVEGAVSYSEFTYEDSPLSRLLAEKYPDGKSVQTAYFAENNYYETTVTDENGHTSTTKTDIIGRQIKTADAIGGFTSFDYDDRNNLLSVTNPEDQQYVYSYDLRNRMRSKKVPGADCQEFIYNNLTDLLVATQDGNLRQDGKWLATEYDAYGRVLKTGFSTATITPSACDIPAGQDPPDPYPYFPLQELLTVNFYDTYTDPVPDCSTPASAQRLKGKLTQTSARVLENGGQTGWVKTSYCYDDYGRQVASRVVSPYADDVYSNSYNFAGLMETALREQNGGELAVLEENVYDHAGRVIGLRHGFAQNVPPGTIPGAGIIATMKYNTKDQLANKVIGGVAGLNYTYANSRGWLTHINQMPFETSFNFPLCDVSDPDPPGGEDPTKSCGECGDELLSLQQLLSIRFDNIINIDCYIPCGCDKRCTPENVIPCLDSTLIGGGLGPVLETEIEYPANLFDVVFCNGNENFVIQDDLPELTETYAVKGRVELLHKEQQFKVETGEGEQVVNVEGLLGLAGQGTLNDIVAGGEEDPCGDCDPNPLPCDPAMLAGQQASLLVLQSNIIQNTNELQFPTKLVRIRLCDGSEIYIFEVEFQYLTGNVIRLQEIEIPDVNQKLVTDTSGFRMTLQGFLNVRNLNSGWVINYYQPCEDNICGNVDNKIYAQSAGGSTIFSTYDGQPPYRNLTAAYPGSENSLFYDFITWDILEPRTWGEAEWNMSVLLTPDSELKYYEVHIIIPAIDVNTCRVGLHDGNGFVPVNGGQDFVTVSGSAFNQMSA
jgi:YD repeat-containing protein